MRFVTASIVTGLFLCTYLLSAQTSREVKRLESTTELIQKVAHVPADALNSPANLAVYIKANTSNEYDCVRFIFYWLIDNIEYDSTDKTSLDFENHPQNIENVFKQKKAVCADYAALLNYLCARCGIPSRIVDGWANTCESSRLSPHAWNIVRVNDIWYPIDATWAAANAKHSGLNNEKIKNLPLDFFLDFSLNFRRTHFPFDPVFQLSSSLMNKLDFMNYEDDTNTFTQRGVCDYLKILQEEINLSPDEQTLNSYERAADFLPEETEIVQNFRFYAVCFINHSFEKTVRTYEKLLDTYAQQLLSNFKDDRNVFINELKKTETAFDSILLIANKIEYYDNAEKKSILEKNKNIVRDRLTVVNEVLISLERLQSFYFPDFVIKNTQKLR